MDKTPQKRHAELCKIIRYHDKLYYQDDTSEISDGEYDRLQTEIESIEEVHPELITPESPTQTVGYTVQKGFKPAFHNPPMLSLAKCHSMDELRAWDVRVKKRLQQVAEASLSECYLFITPGTPGDSMDFNVIGLKLLRYRNSVEFEPIVKWSIDEMEGTKGVEMKIRPKKGPLNMANFIQDMRGFCEKRSFDVVVTLKPVKDSYFERG